MPPSSEHASINELRPQPNTASNASTLSIAEVTVPPNTPTKDAVAPNQEPAAPGSATGDSSSISSRSNSKGFMISELSGMLYDALSPVPLNVAYHTSFTVPRDPIRLHNLGIEDYARVEEWRYYVGHCMIADPGGMDPPLKTPRLDNLSAGSVQATSSHRSIRKKPRLMANNPLCVVVPTPDDVLLVSGSDAEVVPTSAHNGIWQESRRSWDAPKPKFLQRLFQSNPA
ncbi:hypothetical protein FRC17_003516 [Serendipita sp. 399]|nr:hypothetical protein FRC17_003516 [Serendipita sp. 399]